MASLREYRKKIKTVKSTQQITKAMKMVAAARLRRAQARILSARPFALKMRELIGDLAGSVLSRESDSASLPPLFRSHASNTCALVLVTADKGLCGSFNTNLIKTAAAALENNARESRETRLYAIGRKGRDFFKRMGVPVAREYVQIFNNLSYATAEIIGQSLIDDYLSGKLFEVTVVYNEFKSLIQQRLMEERILPLALPQDAVPEAVPDFLYEPEKEKLLSALLPRHVKAQVFRILLESAAAELGARMSAMDNATKNAGELIDMLSLKLNRTRQAVITREIAELVGGAEALK